ncbi:MAG TPA: nitrous oxide reductase accessory protein NosL [Cyclobacteriaceae bacterium]
MKAVVFCVLMLSVISCSVKPEPLAYGKDACYACKMTLVDNRFGAEIITNKGKIYKFDDVNCMVGFYKSGDVASIDVHSILVVNYSQSDNMVDATRALYVQSNDVRSPMGSEVAAFAQRKQAEDQNETWKGKVLNWNEVLLAF